MISISLSATTERSYPYAIHISAEGEIFLDGELLTATKDIYEVIRPDVKRLAPLDRNGIPYELHHPFGRLGDNFFSFYPLTQFEHRIIHYGGKE